MPRRKAPTKEDSALLPPYAQLPDAAIYVPATPQAFAAARAALLAAPVLGFDTESRPLFHAGQNDTGPHLVQFATPAAAWLLQLLAAGFARTPNATGMWASRRVQADAKADQARWIEFHGGEQAIRARERAAYTPPPAA